MFCFCSGGQHWARMLFQALFWTKSEPEPRTNKQSSAASPETYGMFGSVDSHMVARRLQIHRFRADLNRDRWIQSPEC